MPVPKQPAQIEGFVFGKLSEQEQMVLARLALDNQEVFDDLWEGYADRSLLEDPDLRSRLHRKLLQMEGRTGWSRVWDWMMAPPARLAFAGVAVLALALLIGRGPRGLPVSGPGGRAMPTAIVTASGADISALFLLPVRNPARIVFDLQRNPAVFHAGELAHAVLRLRAPATVYVLRRQAGGPVQLAYPNDPSGASDLSAGEASIVFDPLPPTAEVAARQAVLLRVVALPAGKHQVDWRHGGAYSIVEVRYDVVP